MCALASDRQSPAMANSPITSKIHQSLDVHRYFPAQIAFGDPLPHLTSQQVEFRLRQTSNRHFGRNARRGADLERLSPTNAKNVRQGDPHMLPVGDVDSGNSCHCDMVPLKLQSSDSGLSTRTGPSQPCLCLCRPSRQITRTVPFRRITLQLRHSLLTDARTLISNSPMRSSRHARPAVPLQVGLL